MPTVNQQRQNVGAVNAGHIASVSSVQNSASMVALQETQYPLGPASQPLPPLAQGNAQVYLDMVSSANGPTTNATQPSMMQMPPPPVPSQPRTLHKTSSSLDLDNIDGGSQSAAPTSSAQQPTQPLHTSSQSYPTPSAPQSSQPHMSSQSYTAPSSSQASLRQDKSADTEKVASQMEAQEPSMHPFISALKEATSVYDLPFDVLERAVGDVIREDGFIPLVSVLYTREHLGLC
jgi:hypothetical protein